MLRERKEQRKSDRKRKRFRPPLVAVLATALLAVLMATPGQAASAEPVAEDLVFYDDLIGRGVTRDATAPGKLGGRWADATAWRDSWSVVLPVDVNGNGIDELFFYEGSTGTAKIHDVTKNGQLGSVFWQADNWRKTWHSIIAVDVDGDGGDELFMYDRVNGHAKIHDLNSNGTLGRQLYTAENWRSWDLVNKLDVNGNDQDELVLYSQDRFQLTIFDLTPKGKVGKRYYNSVDFFESTQIMEAVDFNGDGNEDLLLYDREGRASIWNVASDATSINRLMFQRWRKTWESITPVDTDGDGTDELFFYEPSKGYAKFHDLKASGSLGRTLSESKGIEENFSTILPIRIDPKRAKPVAYQTKHGVRPPAKPAVTAWSFDTWTDVQWGYDNGETPDDHGIKHYELAVDEKIYKTYGPDSYVQGALKHHKLRHRVTGLKPNTQYKITVTAVDHDGNRTVSAITSARTLPRQGDGQGDSGGGGNGDDGDNNGAVTKPVWGGQVAGQRPVITVTQIVNPNNAIDISWCCASDYDSASLAPGGYDVYISEEGSSANPRKLDDVVSNGGSGEVHVPNLKFNTSYTVQVVAIGINGGRSDALQRTGIEVSDVTGQAGKDADEQSGTTVADPEPKPDKPTGPTDKPGDSGPSDPELPEGDEVIAYGSCSAGTGSDRGVVVVDLVNVNSTQQKYTTKVNEREITRVIPSGGNATVRLFGKADGRYVVSVRRGATRVLSDSLNIRCLGDKQMTDAFKSLGLEDYSGFSEEDKRFATDFFNFLPESLVSKLFNGGMEIEWTGAVGVGTPSVIPIGASANRQVTLTTSLSDPATGRDFIETQAVGFDYEYTGSGGLRAGGTWANKLAKHAEKVPAFKRFLERKPRVGSLHKAFKKKLPVSVSYSRFAGTKLSYEAVVTPEMGAKIDGGTLALPDPYDPISMPTGTSVVLKGSLIEGSELRTRYKLLNVDSRKTTLNGMAFGVTRLDGHRIAVYSGPTRGVIMESFLGIGRSVRVGFGLEGEVESMNLRYAEIDLDIQAGRDAYEKFVFGGSVPSSTHGVRSASQVVTSVSLRNSIEFHVGSWIADWGGADNSATLTSSKFDDGARKIYLVGDYGDRVVEVDYRIDSAGNVDRANSRYFFVYQNVSGAGITHALESFGRKPRPIRRGHVQIEVTGTELVKIQQKAKAYMDSGDAVLPGAFIQALAESQSDPEAVARLFRVWAPGVEPMLVDLREIKPLRGAIETKRTS